MLQQIDTFSAKGKIKTESSIGIVFVKPFPEGSLTPLDSVSQATFHCFSQTLKSRAKWKWCLISCKYICIWYFIFNQWWPFFFLKKTWGQVIYLRCEREDESMERWSTWTAAFWVTRLVHRGAGSHCCRKNDLWAFGTSAKYLLLTHSRGQH